MVIILAIVFFLVSLTFSQASSVTRYCHSLDWIEQGLTSHSTHFMSFRRRWASARTVATVRAHSVWGGPAHYQCAGPLLITVVCMCIIWKALYPYVLDAQLGLWVSPEYAFTCVSTTNQAERCSSAIHLLAGWEHERTTAWWSRAQGGGPSVIPTAGIHYKLRRL